MELLQQKSRVSSISTDNLAKLASAMVSIDVVLQGGFTYLFINTHVNATEFVLFSFYQGQITQVWRMTNNPITNIAGIDVNTVRLSANGNCRGYIFKIGDTSGA